MDIPRPDNFNETYLYEGSRLLGITRASESSNKLTRIPQS